MSLTSIDKLCLDFLKRTPDEFTKNFFENVDSAKQGRCTDKDYLAQLAVLGDRSNETIDSILQQLEDNCGLDEPSIFHLLSVQAYIDEGSPLYEQVKERMAVRLKHKIKRELETQQQDASRAQRRM